METDNLLVFFIVFAILLVIIAVLGIVNARLINALTDARKELFELNGKNRELNKKLWGARKNDHRDPKTGRFISAPKRKGGRR